MFVLFSVLFNLMSNKRLNKSFKTRLRKAAKVGRDDGGCSQFSCSLESSLKSSLDQLTEQ